MTISSELQNLQQDITNARTAVTNKGGTVTSGGGSSQLATDIGTIPTEKPTETFNVTPTTSAQTITPSSGKVFSGGTVQAMPTGSLGTVSASKSISGNTATITPSISGGTAGYISPTSKTGTAVTVTASEVTSGNKAITASTSTQTGIDVTTYATVSVAPTPSESKTLTLGSSSPTDVIVPTSGKYLSYVTVSKDTSIITAANIAKGKTILGVTGTYTGSYIYITSSQKLATLTCGSQNYTLTGDELSHAFAVTNGTYNCKATLGSFSSPTTTVSVSSNTVYAITLTIKRVPSDYQEVEYIQAYGNQYINTLTAPFNGIYCRCRLYLNVSGIARAYFGTGGDDSWGTYEGSYNIWDNYNSDNNTGVGVNFVGSVDITKNGPATNVTYTIGTSTYSASISHGTTYPSDSRPIYILWKNGTTRPKLTGRLVSFQLGRSTTDLIRDFVPCYRRSDNVVGVYDTVSQTLFENAGTGAFTAGPDVN